MCQPTDYCMSQKIFTPQFQGTYSVGTRVVLVRMDDPQAPPVGTKGTVRGVDDIGSIMVAWDNGCGLSVAYGEDICRKLL